MIFFLFRVCVQFFTWILIFLCVSFLIGTTHSISEEHISISKPLRTVYKYENSDRETYNKKHDKLTFWKTVNNHFVRKHHQCCSFISLMISCFPQKKCSRHVTLFWPETIIEDFLHLIMCITKLIIKQTDKSKSVNTVQLSWKLLNNPFLL